MAATFFPSLSYGECGLEDILQLCGDDDEDLVSLLRDTAKPKTEVISCPLIGNNVTFRYPPTLDDSDESTLPSTYDLTSTSIINPGAQNAEQSFENHNGEFEALLPNHPLRDSSGWSSILTQPAMNGLKFTSISDMVPSALMSKSAYPLLNARLRDELVVVYFLNVHPLCPIIDEQNFWLYYAVYTEEDFFSMFPAMLFNAMMFAAFAHATTEQVKLAGFSATIEAQAYYVRALTKMYEYACCQVVLSVSEELALAKTALLLSLWCPPKLELMVNSRWVDRAIHHTIQSLRNDTSDPNALMPKRSNILYWCCIARNTCICFAMRRPYRLFIEDQPLCDPEDVRGEFDREILFHNFSSPKAKLRMVDDFVVLCKLTQKLNSILRFQRSALFELQWNTGQTMTEKMDEDRSDYELHEHLSRYLEAAKLETELLDLVASQERIHTERSSAIITDTASSENPSEEMFAKLRLYTLHIIAYSSITALYQFTLSTTSKLWARSCHRTALLKLRDASTKVALIVQHLLAEISVEAIPGGILAWTIPAMITFMVERNCGKYGLPQLSDNDDKDLYKIGMNSRSLEAGDILVLASALAPRFEAAQDIVSLIQDLDQLLSCDAAVRQDGTRLQVSTLGAATENRKRQCPPLEQVEDMPAADLDLLKHASKFLDTRIAFGCTS